MKSKVGIGITTYLDIASPKFGEAVFDCYASVSHRIEPNKVSIWSQRHEVTSAKEFGVLWATPITWQSIEDRGKGRVMDKGEALIGAEWHRTGSLSGTGSAILRAPLDTSSANEILIEHNYSSRIDWRSLFMGLVDLCQPSDAMLHLFTDAERQRSIGRERLESFDRPFAGEDYFTNWQASSGDWRRPDRWQLSERRNYRFLPQLSWANFLGEEFKNCYSADAIKSDAYRTTKTANGLAFEITSDLRDVERPYKEFEEARAKLKSAFTDECFRL
jgi:hypothetical protein